MIKLLVLLFLVYPLRVSAQTSIEFTGEDIDFEIDSGRFSVKGIYCFFNLTDNEIKQTILFPFPENSDSVVVKRIYNLTYSESIPYRCSKNALTFKFAAHPGDTVKINIAYSQNSAKENVYILKSAQTWGQALKWADFSLKVGKSVQIDSLSILPDSLKDNVYYWTRRDFFPEENFKVWLK
jgi:hypothetical protein